MRHTILGALCLLSACGPSIALDKCYPPEFHTHKPLQSGSWIAETVVPALGDAVITVDGDNATVRVEFPDGSWVVYERNNQLLPGASDDTGL